MQPTLAKRSLASPRELDAKLELLQQLGYEGRYFFEEDGPHAANSAYHNDTDRWIQTEYSWALEEAAESAAGIPDLFDGMSHIVPSVHSLMPDSHDTSQ